MSDDTEGVSLAEFVAARTGAEPQGYAESLSNIAPALRVFTLKVLALPYADHPDYREEWKS